MKVYIWPTFAEKDEGDGGVRRIVELQHDLLPKVADIQIVDLPEDADLLAVHAADRKLHLLGVHHHVDALGQVIRQRAVTRCVQRV